MCMWNGVLFWDPLLVGGWHHCQQEDRWCVHCRSLNSCTSRDTRHEGTIIAWSCERCTLILEAAYLYFHSVAQFRRYSIQLSCRSCLRLSIHMRKCIRYILIKEEMIRETRRGDCNGSMWIYLQDNCQLQEELLLWRLHAKVWIDERCNRSRIFWNQGNLSRVRWYLGSSDRLWHMICHSQFIPCRWEDEFWQWQIWRFFLLRSSPNLTSASTLYQTSLSII